MPLVGVRGIFVERRDRRAFGFRRIANRKGMGYPACNPHPRRETTRRRMGLQ